ARSQCRFSTVIVVSPDTPLERLLEFRDRLRGWLCEQQPVVRDKVDIHVHQITPGGVELSLSLFLAVQTVAEATGAHEAITCEILRLAEALAVDLAPVYRAALPGGARPLPPGEASLTRAA